LSYLSGNGLLWSCVPPVEAEVALNRAMDESPERHVTILFFWTPLSS